MYEKLFLSLLVELKKNFTSKISCNGVMVKNIYRLKYSLSLNCVNRIFIRAKFCYWNSPKITPQAKVKCRRVYQKNTKNLKQTCVTY